MNQNLDSCSCCRCAGSDLLVARASSPGEPHKALLPTSTGDLNEAVEEPFTRPHEAAETPSAEDSHKALELLSEAPQGVKGISSAKEPDKADKPMDVAESASSLSKNGNSSPKNVSTQTEAASKGRPPSPTVKIPESERTLSTDTSEDWSDPLPESGTADASSSKVAYSACLIWGRKQSEESYVDVLSSCPHTVVRLMVEGS